MPEVIATALGYTPEAFAALRPWKQRQLTKLLATTTRLMSDSDLADASTSTTTPRSMHNNIATLQPVSARLAPQEAAPLAAAECVAAKNAPPPPKPTGEPTAAPIDVADAETAGASLATSGASPATTLVSIDALVVLNNEQAEAIRALGEAPRPTKLDHVRWGCSCQLDLARQVPREALIGAMLDAAFVGLPEQRLMWPGVERTRLADGVPPPPICPGGPLPTPFLTHRRGPATLPTEASRFPPFAPAVDPLTLEDHDLIELDHGLLPDRNSPACRFG